MTWRMPSETDPHERTWMAFPCEGPALGGDAASREHTYAAWAAVAHATAEFEPVSMLVDPPEIDRARRMLGSGIELFETPIDECWMRDHGPTFVVDDSRPGCSEPSTGCSTAGVRPVGPAGKSPTRTLVS